MPSLYRSLRTLANYLWVTINLPRYKMMQKKLIREAREYVAELQQHKPRNTYALPLNTFAGIRFIQDPDWRRIYDDLHFSGDLYMHRKNWEYVHCLYGLEKLGMIGENREILGVAAGHEVTLYYLANRCRQVTGTDLYEGIFEYSGGSADAAVLEDPAKYAPFPFRTDHLKFIRMDALNLKFPDSSFDAVVSLSSIEHFGGEARFKQAMGEIRRVLKPGGIAALTTEFVFSRNKPFKFFNYNTLMEYIVTPSGMELTEPFDFTLEEDLFNHIRLLPVEQDRTPHFILQSGPLLFTSISLFLRKNG